MSLMSLELDDGRTIDLHDVHVSDAHDGDLVDDPAMILNCEVYPLLEKIARERFGDVPVFVVDPELPRWPIEWAKMPPVVCMGLFESASLSGSGGSRAHSCASARRSQIVYIWFETQLNVLMGHNSLDIIQMLPWAENAIDRPDGRSCACDSSAFAWTEWCRDFASAIGVLETGHVLRIDVPGWWPADTADGSARYLQCLALDSAFVTIELSDNRFLDSRVWFTEHQHDLLLALGWRDSSHPGHGSPNYYRDVLRIDSAEAAELATETLRDVLCVPHPALLRPSR